MRALTLFFVSILALGSASFGVHAGTLDAVSDSGVLRIGFRENEPPMSFVDADGQVAGYSVELCKRIARGVGAELELESLNVKFVPVTATNRFTALVDGEIDILCGSTTKTLSRAELVDFTQLTFVTGASLIAVNQEGAVETLTDLQDKSVAVTEGTTTIEALEANLERLSINAEVVVVASAIEGFELLLKGEVDALSADQVVLIGLAIGYQGSEKFVVSGDLFSFEPFALAIRHDDTTFRLLADRILANLSRDGEIKSIYQDWFGEFGKEVPELLQALFALGATPR